jgi:shikimate 5-dehydrogenase
VVVSYRTDTLAASVPLNAHVSTRARLTCMCVWGGGGGGRAARTLELCAQLRESRAQVAVLARAAHASIAVAERLARLVRARPAGRDVGL